MKRDNYLLIEKLRHELHQHPELSYNETWTKRHLIDFLKQNTSAEIYDCGKYFYAVFCVYERNTKCCFFYGIGNCSYSSGTHSKVLALHFLWNRKLLVQWWYT